MTPAQRLQESIDAFIEGNLGDAPAFNRPYAQQEAFALADLGQDMARSFARWKADLAKLDYARDQAYKLDDEHALQCIVDAFHDVLTTDAMSILARAAEQERLTQKPNITGEK